MKSVSASYPKAPNASSERRTALKRRHAGDTNVEVAERLREGAELLQAQGANPFRVSAYRRAAQTVEQLETPVDELVAANATQSLMALPGIGKGIAAAIIEMVALGHWSQLERWRGDLDPLKRLQTVPGIGPRLAKRIHDELHVDSLESLEIAAHDGRLESLPGIGKRRLAALRATLANMLGRNRRTISSRLGPAQRHAPSVSLLLDVDREYRQRAATDDLPTIAPRRFNPQALSWLPVLHTVRGEWHITALFSNSSRAHELGRTRDWVVLYFYDGEHRELQATVVTETRGQLRGERVVRGREQECEVFYQGDQNAAT